MRFVYYSEKTVGQCVAALKERLASKGRLDGWVEKDGRFALTISAKVTKRFQKRTQLQGAIEREGNVTIIRGHVADGVNEEERRVILGGLVVLGIFIILAGNLLPGLGVIALGGVLYVMLKGDHQNSKILTGEVQRTLKASTKPPVPGAKTNTTLARSTSSIKKATPVKKPAAPKKPTNQTRKMF